MCVELAINAIATKACLFLLFSIAYAPQVRATGSPILYSAAIDFFYPHCSCEAHCQPVMMFIS